MSFWIIDRNVKSYRFKWISTVWLIYSARYQRYLVSSLAYRWGGAHSHENLSSSGRSKVRRWAHSSCSVSVAEASCALLIVMMTTYFYKDTCFYGSSFSLGCAGISSGLGTLGSSSFDLSFLRFSASIASYSFSSFSFSAASSRSSSFSLFFSCLADSLFYVAFFYLSSFLSFFSDSVCLCFFCLTKLWLICLGFSTTAVLFFSISVTF